MTTGALVTRLSGFIDHTVLKPSADGEVVRAHNLAVAGGCACFVTHARYLPLLRAEKQGTTALSAVIDFPFGLSPADEKLRQISSAADTGATEVEIVVNLADAASGNMSAAESELSFIERSCRGLTRKVIIETAYLDRPSIFSLGKMVAGLGYEFVKTSTGFASRGALVRDIRILRKAAGGRCGVKASGGIRDLSRCLSMISAGAARIGTSRGIEILAEARGLSASGPQFFRMKKIFEQGRVHN